MNILDVMTKADLMKPPDIRDGRNYGGYNLTAHFIKCHGRAMGGSSKPMIFDRARVEAYLDKLFGQHDQEQSEKEARAAHVKAAVDTAVSIVRSASHDASIGSGKILGRGGRVKTASRQVAI